MLPRSVLFSFLLGCLAVRTEAAAATQCRKRFYDQDSFVCVCDIQGCDEIEAVGDLSDDRVAIYSTSSKSDRLKRSVDWFGPNAGRSDIQATLDTTTKKQTVLGFGGAITDAVQVVRDRVREYSETLAMLLHQQYYGSKGLQYTIGRVPLGSCDFSLGEWSFAEVPNDFELDHFNLTDMKANYIVQILKDVPEMKLYASPWSAPGWMKDTGSMTGPGMLIGPFNRRFYLVYARYIIKFFEEYYKQYGVKFWGLTVQNEPDTGALPVYPFQTMYFSSQMQRDFVNLRLGPMMKQNWITKDIKIMGGDGWRNVSFDAAMTIYNIEGDPDAIPGDYTAGLAVHWYVMSTPWSVLSDIHNLRPDKFILATEACNSFDRNDQIPYFGKWGGADLYAHDIIQNLRNWVIGWTDWNLWLDTLGGPNFVGNFVDSPIIVNATDGYVEFFKQPMYYALGHFSKFIPPNSTIVNLTIDQFNEDDLLEGVAAITPDNRVVVVLLNRDVAQTFKVAINDQLHDGEVVRVSVEPQSIKTLIWEYKK